MVRVYKKVEGPRRLRKYGPEQLAAALKDIRTRGMSIRNAAEVHSVPYTTLYENSRGKYSKSHGGQTAFSAIEERTLAEALALCGDWGFPLKKKEIAEIAHGFLQKRKRKVGVFRNNVPGCDWTEGFLKRHKHLTTRFCQNIKRTRARVSRESILAYHESLRETIDGIPPQNIVNYDETGFVDDPGKERAVFRRGSRCAERVIDHSKVHTSVMFAVSASGEVLPPYILYKAKHVHTPWTEAGPARAVYDAEESGWFNMRVFEKWFMTVALPYFSKHEGRKVLIGDNLSSHLSESVISECRKRNIAFVLLPLLGSRHSVRNTRRAGGALVRKGV